MNTQISPKTLGKFKQAQPFQKCFCSVLLKVKFQIGGLIVRYAALLFHASIPVLLFHLKWNFFGERQIEFCTTNVVVVQHILQYLLDLVHILLFVKNIFQIGQLYLIQILLSTHLDLTVGVAHWIISVAIIRLVDVLLIHISDRVKNLLLAPFLDDLLKSTMLHVDLVNKFSILVVDASHLSSLSD